MKNVVIVNDHAYVNGGQAKIALDSALALKQADLNVLYFGGIGPADDRLRQAGVDCEIVGGHDILAEPNRLKAATQGLWNGKAARHLARVIGDHDPDETVVHVHGWSKFLSPSIGPVVTGSAAGHVHTLHEYFLACPNGGFYDYRANRICTRKALGISCLTTNCDARNAGHKAWRVARQAMLWSVGRMPRNLKEVIYLTARQQEIMAGYMPPDTRWHFLPNPVEPAEGGRVAAEDNETVLFVGRLSPEKGAEVAAKAAAIAGVPIAFAGEGERRDAVRAANPDAQMLGWLDRPQLEQWMRRARCVVFPSLWYETYGLVVAEALRRGIPVLVSKDCVAADMIDHGKNGFRFEAGNAAALAACMTRLKEPGTTRAFSEAAYASGALLPDYSSYSARLVEIYEQILARKRRGGSPVSDSFRGATT